MDLKWGKYCDHSSAIIFGWFFFILVCNKTNYKSLDELKFWQDSITDFLELAALERLKNQ